jgi:hypothetical protein
MPRLKCLAFVLGWLACVVPTGAQNFGLNYQPIPPFFVRELLFRPPISNVTSWHAVARNVDGVFVLSGNFDLDGVSNDGGTKLVRLSREGTWDPTFQPGSAVADNGSEPILPVAIQRSGWVIVHSVGRFWRLKVDGSRDDSFPTLVGTRLSLHPDDSFVIADSTGEIRRYLRDGVLDASYNPAPIPNLAHLFFISDRRVVAGVGVQEGFRFIRLEANGTVDANFSITVAVSQQPHAVTMLNSHLLVCSELPSLAPGVSFVRFALYNSFGQAERINDVPNDLIHLAGTFADLRIEFGGTYPFLDARQFEHGGLISSLFSSTTVFPNAHDAHSAAFRPTASFLPHPAPVLPRGPLEPRVLVQPTRQAVAPGGTVTLQAHGLGVHPLTYQWIKDGIPQGNAETSTSGSSLTLSNVQEATEGDYQLTVRNRLGQVMSTAARIALATRPVLLDQPPAALVLAPGQSLALTLRLSGEDTGLRWFRGGVRVTDLSLAGGAGDIVTTLFPAVKMTDAGVYFATFANEYGATVSRPVVVTVDPHAEPGRLENVSVRTHVAGRDDSLIVGFVVGGAPGETLPLLVRGAGPALSAFGVGDVLADPQMTVRLGTQTIAANDDWGGHAEASAAAGRVGAFSFRDPASRDAAVYLSGLAPGAYTAELAGANNTAGTALAELYAPSRGFARILNVSSRARMRPGDALTAGFVIAGQTARTVLARGIAPALATFNVEGTLPAVDVAIFDAIGAKVAESRQYPNTSAYRDATRAVGAFPVTGATNVNAALITTLPPGAYTVQVRSRVTSAAGMALVEIYEVP